MERVAGITEPVDRAKAAIDLMATYQGWVLELSRIRREAIEEAQASGMTQTEIASRLGVSRGRVGQLASAGPPPERAFFGTDLVTVSSAASTRLERRRTRILVRSWRGGPGQLRASAQAAERHEARCPVRGDPAVRHRQPEP
ncbi:sigma factor-like helix-turn-helix DNA-binding protein [Streptomyces thermocarboxydus]